MFHVQTDFIQGIPESLQQHQKKRRKKLMSKTIQSLHGINKGKCES